MLLIKTGVIADLCASCTCLPTSASDYVNKAKNLARDQRLAGMALLTSALAELGVADFALSVSPEGKPSLASLPYHFSLSHSGDLCALALSDSHVGVDLQSIDRVAAVKDQAAFAARYFSGAELKAYEISPTPSTLAEIWTRKEALSKLLGRRLCDSLSSFCSISYGALFETRRIASPSGEKYLFTAAFLPQTEVES